MKYDLDDRLQFGKYRGFLVEDILEKDPNYLTWALANVPQLFEVDLALQDAIIEAARKKR